MVLPHSVRYKGLQGRSYAFGGAGLATFELHVDHVQGDAFAPASRFHITMPMHQAAVPAGLLSSRTRRIAVADFMNRVFFACVLGQSTCAAACACPRTAHDLGVRVHRECRREGADVRTQGGGWKGAKGGEILIDCPNQFVLERTSVSVGAGAVQARYANGSGPNTVRPASSPCALPPADSQSRCLLEAEPCVGAGPPRF